MADLAIGRIKVLTSCALIGEGVDVPSVGGCILLRPTASVGLHLQMIGRCLRPQPGKTAVVLDHVGNTLRLGHHLEPREWSLDGVAKRDREAAPSVKVCPACFATSPSAAQICGDCGHEFAPPERRELQQVDGELVEIKAKAGSSLAISVGDIVFVGTGSQGRATAVNVIKIHRTKIHYWPVGKEQELANSYYDAWHYNILEFKRGQLVQKRDFKTDLWEDDWVFYDYCGTGKRCTIIKKDDYNFNENQPFKPWAIGSTTHRKVLTHNVKAIDALSTGNRAYEQGSARDLDALRELAKQRGYKRGWAERVYQARLAKG